MTVALLRRSIEITVDLMIVRRRSMATEMTVKLEDMMLMETVIIDEGVCLPLSTTEKCRKLRKQADKRCRDNNAEKMQLKYILQRKKKKER